jgi:hypothetical protein
VIRSTGRDAAGDVVSEFEISWSFKRRMPSRDGSSSRRLDSSRES